jgi:glyoxylase-like metal-dependent hydrolase (beta-lactamase superfamily II)
LRGVVQLCAEREDHADRLAPGELCANDRATLFEDPTGVRILYDVGQTVTGADDPRLGTVHAVLLSHIHGDHVGDQKLKAPAPALARTPSACRRARIP